MKRLLVFMFILLCVSIGYAADTNDIYGYVSNNVYHNKPLGISFLVPKNWVYFNQTFLKKLDQKLDQPKSLGSGPLLTVFFTFPEKNKLSNIVIFAKHMPSSLKPRIAEKYFKRGVILKLKKDGVSVIDNDVKPLVISGQKFEQIYFPVISSTGNIKPMHCVILLSVKNNYLVKITSCTQKLTYAEIDSQLSKLIKIEK